MASIRDAAIQYAWERGWPRVNRWLADQVREHYRHRNAVERAAGQLAPADAIDTINDAMSYSGYEPINLDPVNPNFAPRKAPGGFRRLIAGRRYARPRSIVRRRTRRGYGRRRFKTSFRARIPRRTTRRYRRTTRRFGRRGRIGRGGRRYGRVKRQTFKARVRKIIGNCFNQVMLWDNALMSCAFASRLTKPNLCRIASGWYGTREEMLRIMSAVISGPSTSTGSDMNLNRHVWIQKCMDNFHLHTPGKVPVFYKLYRLSLKCNDRGATGGTYVEGTLPFSSGSATDATNTPDASYWSFWDQTSRQAQTGSGYLPLSGDGILAKNIPGASYVAPTAGSDFEAGNTSAGTPSLFHFSTPLSFIFPELKRKCKIRLVSKGVLLPGMKKKITVRTPYPAELRPRDYISDECPNFSKYSHFYFLRAVTRSPDSKYGLGADNTYFSPFSIQPAQIVVGHLRRFAIRASGDSIPSFTCAASKDTVVNNGWLGSSFGFISSGSEVSYSDTTALFYSSSSMRGDVPICSSGALAAVTTRNQQAY